MKLMRRRLPGKQARGHSHCWERCGPRTRRAGPPTYKDMMLGRKEAAG